MSALLKRSALTLALLGANQALAGGLWLNEFGDFSGGRASAGAEAGTDDAAAIIHNPAGASRIKGNQLFGSIGALIPKVEFDVQKSGAILGDDNGGDAGLIAPGASMAYIYDNGWDKWSTGISLAGMAGAGLDYNDDWVGRYQATDVDLLVMYIGAAIAYQVTDDLTIGVTPQIYYATLEQKLALPTSLITQRDDSRAKLNGDDTGFGAKVGVIYELSPATRLGLTWQSEFDINFDGDLKVYGDIATGTGLNSDTELNLAQYVRLALHHDVNDRLGLDFTVGWDDWSELDRIFVSLDSRGGAPIATQWKDTYHYAAGFQYKLDDNWDLTAGIAYDTSPVSAQNRVAQLPIGNQTRYNVGAQYHLSDTLHIGGYLNYTDLGKAEIVGEYWSGKYSTNEMYQVSMFVNWTY